VSRRRACRRRRRMRERKTRRLLPTESPRPPATPLRQRSARRRGGEELPLQSDEGALERASDAARKQGTVEQAGDAPARLVLDDEAVGESVAVGLEVALVVRLGQAGLRTRMGHEPIRLERPDRHHQLSLAPEQPRHQSRCVTARAPVRALIQADVAGPEPRPVCGVRDEGEAALNRDVEPSGNSVVGRACGGWGAP
jgi:hypothetical protein